MIHREGGKTVTIPARHLHRVHLHRRRIPVANGARFALDRTSAGRAIWAGDRIINLTVGGVLLIVAALVAGAVAILRRSRSGPRSSSAKIGRGCLWAGVSGVGVAAIGLIVLVALLTRSCSQADDPYVVKITDVNDEGICLERVDDGPDWIEGCQSRSGIEDLPSSVAVGQCLVLRESHPLTYYVKVTACPA